ncbi:hypothetical protein Tco_1478680 [Tanacetum coccineum]
MIINIPEEDVESKPNLPLQEIIILDPVDQPMWENAKIIAPTPNSSIVHPNVDDNFVINSTHLKMIWEKKFDGYLWADPHDDICEFLTICDMFKYGETQNEPTQGILDETAGGIFLYKCLNQAFQLLESKVLFNLDWSTKSQTEHHQKSVAFADRSNSNKDIYQLMKKLKAIDSQIISLKEEIQDMHDKYNNLRNNNASKNRMNDDTPMCERHEANYIQSEGYENRNSYDSFSYQSLHDPNDSEKSLT